MSDLKPSMLIVEDEELTRITLTQIFKGLGHSVRSVSDGLAALVEFFAELCSVPRSAVSVLSGAQSRNKVIRIAGRTGTEIQSAGLGSASRVCDQPS